MDFKRKWLGDQNTMKSTIFVSLFLAVFVGGTYWFNNSEKKSELPEILVGDSLPVDTFKEVRIRNLEPLFSSYWPQTLFQYDDKCWVTPHDGEEVVLGKTDNRVLIRFVHYSNNLRIYDYNDCPSGAIYFDELENFLQRKNKHAKNEAERQEELAKQATLAQQMKQQADAEKKLVEQILGK